MKKKINNGKFDEILLILLFGILLLITFSFYSNFVSGGVSVNGNATVITQLQVGQIAPEVLNVSLDSPVTLNVNSTKLVSCIALIRDWNNDSDFNIVTGHFFNSSSINDPLDNNNHYYNSSCFINTTGSYKGVADTIYTALANCTFNVTYYANPGFWNCTIFVNDTYGWNHTQSNNGTVNELIGLEVPNSINYGIVNSTYVSEERIANVSNAGNVRINLSLSGYGRIVGDGLAMNCSLGSIPNISIMYEKYNLTSSNTALNLAEFEAGNYTNLTSGVPAIKKFDLSYRDDDLENNAINSTYWRIYVPMGVAGTCTGNIIFGATRASGN